MRRYLFPALGLVEVVVAALLVALGVSLPTQDDVRESFEGAGRVTASAGELVVAVRGRVGALRHSKLRETADRLGGSTRSMANAWKAQRIDFDRVRELRDALGRSADGLTTLSDAFDPEALGKLGAGLGEAADFLDRGVVPAAEGAAEGLDEVSGPLLASARGFARVAREARLDLTPVREFSDSLARFDEGMAATGTMLDPRRLVPLREAAEGAEGVIDEAARLAERAAGYTYPVVEFEGLKPKVRARPFWPRGAEIGADLRKVSAGVTATGREVDALARELPRVQASVAESRRTLGATRKALAGALSHQKDVDRLLKDIPEHADRLAEALPKLTAGLSRALKETGRLREAAGSLRQARRGLDASAGHWPEVRKGLLGSASLLKAAGDQLDGVARRRAEYEAAAGEVERLSAEFATMAPAAADGLAGRLDAEDRALAEMAAGIGQVDDALPKYARALSRCLWAGRIMAWLVASVAGLHGSFLILGLLRGGPDPAT